MFRLPARPVQAGLTLLPDHERSSALPDSLCPRMQQVAVLSVLCNPAWAKSAFRMLFVSALGTDPCAI